MLIIVERSGSLLFCRMGKFPVEWAAQRPCIPARLWPFLLTVFPVHHQHQVARKPHNRILSLYYVINACFFPVMETEFLFGLRISSADYCNTQYTIFRGCCWATLIKKRKSNFPHVQWKEIQSSWSSSKVINEEGLPNIWGNAQIFSPYLRRPLVILYMTFWISLYMRKIWFSF